MYEVDIVYLDFDGLYYFILALIYCGGDLYIELIMLWGGICGMDF